METNSVGASPNNERHRIFYKQPKRVPPFDTAFVRSSNREGLKVLLSAAPEHCQIILFTDGPGAAYAMKRLFKRNFKLCSQALQLDLRTLTFTGQVVFQFVRGGAMLDPLARYFCAGDSYLHELAQTNKGIEFETDTIDMFCCGIGFHRALRERGRGRSLVFAEEQ
ncbi:hypothetical protein pEaSNUABM40_00010 [Erwinia phage pEa_SNUABM_40]|uniref:Uncharacterized protein n=1 Tax=Erwinia phage pEa_SNUABM_3 TaxID=2869552 RepID=A0AAE7XIQ7_9CAUD|nr:hypothetical protein MPK68_gp010 [Erwinia phage pEa_SNUABM_3]QZE56546.1 hypothetical protein pEaSNUABM20_00010 [Erwinia phage pEa_SNUABM_20]QZE58226.1 hypothetical protein pEaSNUABM40_00010 [Erwinia phage pEa_SNUABM_40]UAW52792.1 hypothetical protein pEaSNUABM23_00010 [Erwinia phage pEa_SNUABM_23]UIW10688.1 hypothetical protein pEaSNUABM23_00010 [Erwinia phage pEa_SNUABM_31]QZE56207.1 hypothetical protein pEaSNUABM3_00010 [Erwinia phage pEa_SNUABM_3]